MSGSIGTPSPTGGTPLGINPLTGQLVVPGQNSMAPAFAPGVGQAMPGQAPIQAPQQAPPVTSTPAQRPSLPMSPPVAPQAPQGAPPAQPQAAPQGAPGQPPAAPVPVDPTTKLLNNYAHYESAGGTRTGNGGGALQFEPAEQKAFTDANPAFAGQPVNTPGWQKAAGTWLTTTNAGVLTKAGVDPNSPGSNYAAFALGAPTVIAMAKAPDPTVDATKFVSALPNGPSIIKGNPALFAGGATINDVYARADSIQNTGALPNATQIAPAAPAPASGPPGAPPSNPGDAALDTLPPAPQLTPARANPWEAFASGMLGSHNLAAGLGAGFAGVNAAQQGNQQSVNDTALAQQNAALNTATAKISIGKMSAFQPVIGQAGVRTTPSGNIYLSKNQFGQEQWQDASGQIVSPSGQPLSETMSQAKMANSDAVVNARLLNSNNNKTAGVGADGSYNAIPTTTVQPPAIPGTSIPSAPASPPVQPTAVPPGHAASAAPSADPVATAAAPFIQTMAAQAQGQNIPPTLAKTYVATNQAAYDATQKAAVTATDANVAAEKALQAVNTSPEAFPQSSAWGGFVNNVTSKLGYNPFGTVTNGQIQLSQAFLKQANAGGMGDMLHNAMGISRPSQMEVQMVQHAVANGTMPITTLNALMQSGINNNNSAIAEGRLAQGIWANGRYAALPGAFTSAMTTVQSNLENGKYPDLYKPMVSLPPTNAPAGGTTPGAPQPGGGAATGLPTVGDAASYALVQPGTQYLYNGQVMTKAK